MTLLISLWASACAGGERASKQPPANVAGQASRQAGDQQPSGHSDQNVASQSSRQASNQQPSGHSDQNVASQSSGQASNQQPSGHEGQKNTNQALGSGECVVASIDRASGEVYRLPARLCVNENLYVDRSEVLPERKPTEDPNVVREEYIDYEKLPAEVREVIELTDGRGKRYQGCKFELILLRRGDVELPVVYRRKGIDFRNPRTFGPYGNPIKVYLYSPSVECSGREVGGSLPSWRFVRQRGKLRLLDYDYQIK